MRSSALVFCAGLFACASDVWLGDIETAPAESIGAEDGGAPPLDIAAMGSLSRPSPLDVRKCGPNEPFNPPVPVAELNINAASSSAWLTPDTLTVLFVSDDSAVAHIYQATRPSVDAPWGTPVRLDELGAADNENATSPSLSPDRRTIYFESSRSGHPQIWYARRATATGPFDPPAPVATLADPENTGQVQLSGGTTLMFVSRHTSPNPNETTLGGTDVYRADVLSPGVTTPMLHVTELSSTDDEWGPVMSDDGLLVFVSRRQSIDGGPSLFRIWSASRTDTSSPFGNLALVPSLASGTGFDLVTWVSPNACTVYLESTKSGKYRIYMATR